MRQAISPRLATRRLRIMFVMSLGTWRSHAEEPEARVCHGPVAHGSERKPQDPTRLERIDHSIIPEARGRVIRMPLALVLLADRLLESFLLSRRPVAART